MSETEAATFIRACSADELKDGGVISVVLAGDEVALVKTGGEVFAILGAVSNGIVSLVERGLARRWR